MLLLPYSVNGSSLYRNTSGEVVCLYDKHWYQRLADSLFRILLCEQKFFITVELRSNFPSYAGTWLVPDCRGAQVQYVELASSMN